MKFCCSKQILQDAISIVAKAVTGNSNLPILKGILLEISNSQMRMTATDTDITIQSFTEINSSSNGSIVLDARVFGDIVKMLPNDEVEITIDEELNTEIKCNKVQFKIKGLNADEYPKPLPINQNESFIMSQELLKTMIRKTSFAASQDELKPILTGVLFEIQDENLNMVAVDGYRLALRKCKIDNNNIKKDVVVPAKTLNEVMKLLELDKDVKIYISNNYILFDLGNSYVYSRLLEGDFLNYNPILQNECTTRVRVNTKQFLSGIERASLIINSKDNKSIPVKLNIVDEKVVITANSDIGQVYEEVVTVNDGRDLEIGFNPKYIIDIFKILDNEEEVYMEYSSNLSPCIIKAIDSGKFTYLILPIRLKNA